MTIIEESHTKKDSLYVPADVYNFVLLYMSILKKKFLKLVLDLIIDAYIQFGLSKTLSNGQIESGGGAVKI